MLGFKQLFPEIASILNQYKVHLAIGKVIKKEPLMELSKGKFKEWQEYQNNKNFERDYILSLVYYRPSEWIYAGIYKRLDVQERYNNDKMKKYFQYQTELLDIQTDLIGRMSFYFSKDFRQSYVLLEKHYDKFFLKEILPQSYRVNEFSGYENVVLTYENLKEIIVSEELSWKTALSNVKGVYLITDLNTGKQYVGSAYGEDAFWSRWQAYADNGHGNNVELIKLLKDTGNDYVNHLQFSILEIRNRITDDEEIIKRESHWKKILGTREYGFNSN
jgi:hypothetical protein